jgi:TonB-dependent receptor
MKGRAHAFYRCTALTAAGLALALIGSESIAAEERGGLRGRVADPSNNPLPGATVRVEPGALTVVSDREGSFSVPNLAAGTYKVEISYIGFLTEARDAHVTLGGQARVDVKLKPAVSIAEEVTVTASRSLGEIEALNQKKNADNILDVLPAEIITSLPNANVADALGRLPSVSLERDEGEGKYIQVRGLQPAYTNVTINGAHVGSAEIAGGGRSIKLDIVPADLVGSLELNKTLSAEQDGDAIGGSVNLVTKAATDETHFSLGTQQGYTKLSGGRYVTVETGTYSGRFGADKALGLVLGGSFDYNGRAINDMEPAPNYVSLPDGSQVPGLPSVDFRDYAYERKRFGFAGGLDYRLNPSSEIYVHGLFSQFLNYGDRWVGTPVAGNFLTPTQTDETGTYLRNNANRRPNEQIASLSAGGKHELQSLVLDYNLAYSHSRQNYDDAREADFAGPANVAYSIDNSDPKLPKFIVTNGVSLTDPSQYTMTNYAITHEDTHQNNYEGALNVALPYKAGAHAGTFKFGGKYREDDKDNKFGDRTFSPNGTITLSQVLDSYSDPNYYFGLYPLGPLVSLDKSTSFFNSNPGAFTENTLSDKPTNDSNNWNLKEKIGALYAMNTVKFGALNLQVGVRVEHTSASYNANQVTFDVNGNYLATTPVSSSTTYTDVLPSVQLRYEVGPNTNLRAVYGQALARPDIVDVIPSIFRSDQNRTLSVGNPNLIPTHSRNYDVLFEHYLGSVGVVSAGGFYKTLLQPIYGSTQLLTDGQFAGYVQSSFVNGPSARVYGFEVAWQQHLTFLPGFWSGFGVLANYTHTDSKATFDSSFGRSDTPRLQRTTPNEANFNLTYDKGGLSIRGALTYNDATLFTYAFQDGAIGGPSGPLGDRYIYPHTQIDAQASYTLKSGLRILASVLNINNEVFGFYSGSPLYNIQREFYGTTFFVGVGFNR